MAAASCFGSTCLFSALNDDFRVSQHACLSPFCAARGLHFLAVQPDPDSEELTGLWLLQDRMPPNV